VVAPVIGAAGAGAAAGMNGMAGSPPGGFLGVLTEYSPGILIVSVLLVTTSLAWRRALAAVPAPLLVCCCMGGCTPSPAIP